MRHLIFAAAVSISYALFVAIPLLVAIIVAIPLLRATNTAALANDGYMVCIGDHACSEATHATCSVALGDGVQLPERSDHVLATMDGVARLSRLDRLIVARINEEIQRMHNKHPDWAPLGALDPNYVKEWNAVCAPASLSL